MIHMKRILVPVDSYDPSSWAIALQYAKVICEADERAPKVALIVHTMQQISSTSLSGFLGERQAKALKSRKPLSFEGGTLRLETMKTMPSIMRDTVAIVFYADEQLIDKVEDVNGLNGIVAVPWVAGELDSWASRWGAVVHGEEQRPQAKIIEDPVVEKALVQLVQMVNSSTGIGHPRDKTKANETLRILRAKGHQIDAASIRSWVLQRGWKSHQADDLGALAAKVGALKNKPRLTDYHDPEGRYGRWSS